MIKTRVVLSRNSASILVCDKQVAESLLIRLDLHISCKRAGDKDPWEKVEWGREFRKYETVEEFIELPGVGHCPMDEAPDVVNPRMLDFIQRHFAAA